MSEHYLDVWKEGIYHCSRCGNPLFDSASKFSSDQQCPSFRDALPGGVTAQADLASGVERTEAVCARCGLHVGYVIRVRTSQGDGQWYCTHSESMTLFERETVPR